MYNDVHKIDFIYAYTFASTLAGNKYSQYKPY